MKKPLSPQEANRLKTLATYASCGVASILILTKLVAFLMTDLVTILSSLLDSTVDLAASLITLWAVAHAQRPPDADHRYGHGKAEPLAALAQATFITGSAVLLSFEAMGRFFSPQPAETMIAGYVVTVFAMIMTFGLVMFQRSVIKRTNSLAVNADSLHYSGDLLMNAAVMASLFAQQFTGISWIDPLFGLGIAIGLLVNAWRVGRSALNVLMDMELPDEQREEIRQTVLAVPQIRGVHDLRTRTDGERLFIEMHIEVPASMTVEQAHGLVEASEDALKKLLPQSDVLIHMDPEGHEELRRDELLKVSS